MKWEGGVSGDNINLLQYASLFCWEEGISFLDHLQHV